MYTINDIRKKLEADLGTYQINEAQNAIGKTCIDLICADYPIGFRSIESDPKHRMAHSLNSFMTRLKEVVWKDVELRDHLSERNDLIAANKAFRKSWGLEDLDPTNSNSDEYGMGLRTKMDNRMVINYGEFKAIGFATSAHKPETLASVYGVFLSERSMTANITEADFVESLPGLRWLLQNPVGVLIKANEILERTKERHSALSKLYEQSLPLHGIYNANCLIGSIFDDEGSIFDDDQLEKPSKPSNPSGIPVENLEMIMSKLEEVDRLQKEIPKMVDEYASNWEGKRKEIVELKEKLLHQQGIKRQIADLKAINKDISDADESDG